MLVESIIFICKVFFICLFEIFVHNLIFLKQKSFKVHVSAHKDKMYVKKLLQENIPDFTPLLHGEYIQTILGLFLSMRAPPSINWKHRSRNNTYWWETSEPFKNSSIVICVPGFCGNVRSHYINQLCESCLKLKIDLVVLDIRSLHVGETKELHELVSLYSNDYQNIFLIGISLGGNIVSRYCSDINIPKTIKCIISLGNGFDLQMVRDTMNDSLSKIMCYYCKKWLSLLNTKAKITKSDRMNSVWDMIGYILNEDINTYLYNNSSHETYKKSKLPLFIVNSIDDPFFSFRNLNDLYNSVNLNKNIIVITTPTGGHIGWCKGLKNVSWFFDDVFPLILQCVN